MSVVERPGAQATAWPSSLVPSAAMPAWVQLQGALAACSRPAPCEADPEAWFAGAQSPRLEEARGGCGRCPVLHLCRDYAVAAEERDGVWGGTTPGERRAMRRRVAA